MRVTTQQTTVYQLELSEEEASVLERVLNRVVKMNQVENDEELDIVENVKDALVPEKLNETIYLNEVVGSLDIVSALNAITDKGIRKGNYSDQTVMDMRDQLKKHYR